MGYAGKWARIIDTTRSITDGRKLMMPHQQNAVDALNKYYDLSGNCETAQSGLLIMPTGSGKTFTTITWLMESAIPAGYRVVWFAHRQGLVEQALQEFCKVAPILSERGITKIKILPISGHHASMSQACGFDINVCSILSVASKNGIRFIRRMLGAAGSQKVVVVVDEAHHAPMNSYKKVLDAIKRINPSMVLLGITATPKRLADNQQLLKMFNVKENHEKRGSGFIYEVSLQELIQYKYLAAPHYEPVYTDIKGDVAYKIDDKSLEFFQKFGELGEEVLDRIAQSKARNMCIVNYYVENKKKFGKTLIFAINQSHAKLLCEEFEKAGISCNYAISNRPDSQDVIDDFRKNEFEVLINVQMMTEGSDVPDIQTVFMTRETNSDTLFMQMVGRALRGTYAGGTEDAFIVDFHDNWKKLHFWFKPEGLDIFNVDEESTTDGAEDIIQPVTEDVEDVYDNHDEEVEEEVELISQENLNEMRKIIDENLVTNWQVLGEYPHFPVGWYSIADNVSIVVMNDQLVGYQDILQNIGGIIKGRISVKQIRTNYFVECTVPKECDITEIVNYIIDNQIMPKYYEFGDIDEASPYSVADMLMEDNIDNIDNLTREALVKIREYYNKSDVMKALYSTIGGYKRAVENALAARRQAKIFEADERRKYHLIPDYYDIDVLAAEVYHSYPKLKDANVLSITWSERVVKSWFGQCHDLGDSKYKIRINKLLSSPDVNREAIKYVIYHELLHANGLWSHDVKFRDEEWSYLDSELWDGELDSLAERYKIDFSELKGKFPGKRVSTSPKSSCEEEPDDKSFNPNAKGVIVGFKYCRNCGHKLPVSSKFCDKCGENIQY